MNNFNQSSTGLNITVSAFRDTDLSRFYFEEAFFTIKEGNKDLLVYCEGSFSDFEKEYYFTKAELVAAWSKVESKADFSGNFDIVVSRGYCQGDYREVIVPHKFWDCIGIVKPLDVQSNLGNHIDNLLWECPVCARFSVNGVDFDICESMANMYNWDTEEALEIAAELIKDSFTSEEQAIIMDFLTSSLKTDLDYQ